MPQNGCVSVCTCIQAYEINHIMYSPHISKRIIRIKFTKDISNNEHMQTTPKERNAILEYN